MIEYNTTITYYVMGSKLELFSDHTAYGWATIAEVNNRYHYLGDQLVNLQTAISLWEKLTNRSLNTEEIELVAIENGIKSQAV